MGGYTALLASDQQAPPNPKPCTLIPKPHTSNPKLSALTLSLSLTLSSHSLSQSLTPLSPHPTPPSSGGCRTRIPTPSLYRPLVSARTGAPGSIYFHPILPYFALFRPISPDFDRFCRAVEAVGRELRRLLCVFFSAPRGLDVLAPHAVSRRREWRSQARARQPGA